MEMNSNAGQDGSTDHPRKAFIAAEIPEAGTSFEAKHSCAVASRPPHRSQDVAGMTVLVCDEHYKHSLGIVRSLGKLGVNVHVLAVSESSLVCRSRFCRNVIISKSPSTEDLADAAVNAVQKQGVDLVIPVSYSMTLAMARRQQDFCRHTRVELADPCNIERAADKLHMAELAESIGVPAPKTMLGSAAARRTDELIFPVVVKPRKESPGRPPVRYAHGPAELLEMLHHGVSAGPTELLVQEFVPGIGYGFFAVYQRGVCKRVFMHRRVREYPASGGVSTCAESFYDSTLESHGRRMLDALKWHGVGMVEFRRDARDGTYNLIEINPKFWGSLDLALAAGADFPGDLCRMALGHSLSFTDDYQRNLRFQWPLSSYGELFHLWTRPTSFLPIALDLLNPSVRSNLWLRDPAPNLLELRALAGQLFRAKSDKKG